MQRLEVSCAVRRIYMSLGAKGLKIFELRIIDYKNKEHTCFYGYNNKKNLSCSDLEVTVALSVILYQFCIPDTFPSPILLSLSHQRTQIQNQLLTNVPYMCIRHKCISTYGPIFFCCICVCVCLPKVISNTDLLHFLSHSYRYFDSH
jgi:hypothetical protein